MARCAEDLDLGLDVLAGPDPEQSVGWKLDLPRPSRTLAGTRVAVWMQDDYCPIDSEVGDVLYAAVDAVRAAGAVVRETPGPVPLRVAHQELYQPLLMGVVSGIFPPEVFDEMLALAQLDPEDNTDVELARSVTMRVRDWNHLNERRYQAAAAWARFFDDYDVLLCPVAPTVAIPHDHNPDFDQRVLTVNGVERPYQDQQIWTGMVTMPFLPAVSAPIGPARSGLPVGIQVVAPHLRDRTAVAVAGQISDLVGGFRPPPGSDRALWSASSERAIGDQVGQMTWTVGQLCERID